MPKRESKQESFFKINFKGRKKKRVKPQPESIYSIL